MTTIIILVAAYLSGLLLAYHMLKIEHVATNPVYTIGNRFFNIILSQLGWIMVFIILIITWIKYIKQTGYWNKPLK